ncbi:GntR family transcriptional regulator [Mesorhizobium sp. GR13]|uniref:GntR family transcriptional regulator n=1 Tax=Mesorhizobium sp. GR13 TaxID=2562308 RepID=UPI0010C11BF3|nr:GntR family transcriptional regulator [Mesorhizobium sp. GR13]
MSGDIQIKAFDFKPLYLQVKERLIRRLIDGSWLPGQLIPSEIDLARELSVSQGTVRKALDTMTTDNLLIRRQGRGTYVSSPEESRILFNFFRMVSDNGERTFPDSHIVRRVKGKVTRAEMSALALAEGAEVWRIERVRTLAATPLIVETIVLPARRFPGFTKLGDIPNNVYRLYSDHWGISIASAVERLKAVAASKRDAAQLECDPGAPLLEIARVASDLAQNPVELRISRCRTDAAHYRADLK